MLILNVSSFFSAETVQLSVRFYCKADLTLQKKTEMLKKINIPTLGIIFWFIFGMEMTGHGNCEPLKEEDGGKISCYNTEYNVA